MAPQKEAICLFSLSLYVVLISAGLNKNTNWNF